MLPTYIGALCKRGHVERYASGGCVQCNRQRLGRQSNSHHVRAWALAHPEERRESRRKYYRAHKQRLREQFLADPTNAEKQRAVMVRYRQRHPQKIQELYNTRRARILNAPGRGVTSPQWQQIRTDSFGLCAYCNERRRLTPDHIEPLVRGGAHDTDNIAAVCLSCNLKKHDISLLVWLARKGEGGRAKRTGKGITL